MGMNEGFTYLVRVFDFNMDDEAHKTLVKTCKRILEDIDRLPLHPKHKIELYSKFLMSKISWDLTISDINITWVKQTLDSVSSSFVRKWLEIPINGTLDKVTLSKEKFCLNIIKILLCYVHCQMIHNYKINSHRCVQHIVYEHVVFLYKFRELFFE